MPNQICLYHLNLDRFILLGHKQTVTAYEQYSHF